MVECNLAKVEVAGSNPVSRSSKFRGFLLGESPFFCTRTYLPDSVPLLRGCPKAPCPVAGRHKKRAMQASFLLFLPFWAI